LPIVPATRHSPEHRTASTIPSRLSVSRA
jgi:hypothetical protein